MRRRRGQLPHALGTDGFLRAVGAVRADTTDPDDLRLRKALLVATALVVSAAGLLWGLLYVAFGEPLAG